VTAGNNTDQTYFWDGNLTGMEEEGRNHFYFQDDLGSPMRLADEAGRSEEIYGYDEFGNDIRTGQDIRTAHDIFKSPMQSFGFTGYQMDEAGGLYFAQARRYDAGAGRFTSEDFIKGHIAVPYTMNHYNYCWNRPVDLVDLNGMWPSLSDIGKGIKKTAGKAGKFVSDHKQQIAAVGIAVGTIVAAGAVSCIPVVGTVAAGAVMGAGLDAAIQYGTTGKIDAKEVAISGVTGAVASCIPIAGAGVGAKVLQATQNKITSSIATVVTESVLNGGTSMISSFVSNKLLHPELSNEEIWTAAKIDGVVGTAMGGIVSGLKIVAGQGVVQNVNNCKTNYSYASSGVKYSNVGVSSDHYIGQGATCLGNGLRNSFYQDSKNKYIGSIAEKMVFDGIVDSNSSWWSYVLAQSLQKGIKKCQLMK
ncbi:MAG: RHS repeat-associated core domain-containing protein, partial [Agathobacter sp.]|nr:RHS repeat-associated core domain-containing protein [Agathobacter sp.]